jgi:hypothetical protein
MSGFLKSSPATYLRSLAMQLSMIAGASRASRNDLDSQPFNAFELPRQLSRISRLPNDFSRSDQSFVPSVLAP